MPRILVVDDDQMVCEAIEVCLQHQGFDVERFPEKAQPTHKKLRAK